MQVTGVDRARIERVRQAIEARARGPKESPKARHWTHAFFDLYADLPLWERQARSLAYALVNEPVRLFPEERLVGTIYQGCPGAECVQWGGLADEPRWADYTVAPHAAELVRQRVPENEALVSPEGGAFLIGDGAAPGHIGWQWDQVLSKGVLGILADLRQALASAPDEKARQFLQGAIIAWEAVLEWNDRHLAALEARLAETDSPAERAELARLLEICRRVPAHPARSFREAVQAFHFQHLAVMFENPYGGNGPGRFDYFLGPYLERDLDAGAITLDEARELIDELFLKFHERLFPIDGWVETIVVGGVDPNGEWAGNALSRIVIESFMWLEQTHPAVYVRLARSAPDDFVDLTVRYLLEGKNRAQILNDDAILPAMRNGGIADADAPLYMCGGCMEISPQGLNSDMNFSFTYNAPKTVELVLTGGECLVTGKRRVALERDLTGYASFEELYQAYEAELQRELTILFRRLDCWSEAFAEWRPAYLISSLVGDCVARGRNMHDGGARYHDYAGAPVGIPNAGDALYGVQQAVFVEKRCTAAELLAALRADFEGYEELRRYLRALPKFGQEHPGADAMTDRVLRSICAAFASYRNRFGGRVKPMIFNFVWTPMIGQALGATADGRRAGQPVAHGLTPQAVGMTQGLTAAINSSTSLTLEGVTGGSTTMWDVDPEWARPALMKAVLRSFLERGGQIFQGNATSVAELERALERPEDYPNLMVRVGGYSARFTSLDRALQEEIVRRHRHRG
ncbi:MAG: hypothetical protein GX774_16890 [Armatimonadetes bacterium]|nr:hypothetical protein [Armatimonadota bacterium]